MSRRRRLRREQAGPPGPAPGVDTGASRLEPPGHALIWLLAAFLLPNLGVLASGFVLDDLPLLVENEKLHSLTRLMEIWTSGYWPDRSGLTLYRPLTQTLWACLWTTSGGAAAAFHGLNLLAGAGVVLLAYELLSRLAGRASGFVGALLFAVLPIHTEATASVVGSAELLAAGLGIAALLAHEGRRRGPALLLFALAVAAKESAAAVALLAPALAFVDDRWRRPRKEAIVDGGAASAVVLLALWARSAVTAGPSFIPPIDNPMSLVDPARRVLTALWIQMLYIQKSLVPVALSADYSYKEIPLVMGLEDVRAWAGLLLAVAALLAAWRWREGRTGIALYAILFAPAANLLFPIGTMMGERLAYLPSLGLCLLGALLLTKLRRPLPVLTAIVLLYAGRTVIRNHDWKDADTFYPRLVETSPNSAKAHYFLGALLASRGLDPAAIDEYDQAVAIFPAYSEAFHNRGNALARLGRREQAAESFRACLRFDPGHTGAAANLRTVEAGLPLAPARRRL